jgi:predicted DCC family thiol-disulfide oxidoreductase YuxK
MPEPGAQLVAERPIVLFDGLCAFCDGTVGLLMRLDRRGRLRFAALQSEAGQALVRAFGVPDDVDSVVLIDGDLARVHSDAALGIARVLGLPWSVALVLWVVPRPLRDWAYRLFARHRYRLFGKREACRMPGEDERGLVLEGEGEARALVAGL